MVASSTKILFEDSKDPLVGLEIWERGPSEFIVYCCELLGIMHPEIRLTWVVARFQFISDFAEEVPTIEKDGDNGILDNNDNLCWLCFSTAFLKWYALKWSAWNEDQAATHWASYIRSKDDLCCSASSLHHTPLLEQATECYWPTLKHILGLIKEPVQSFSNYRCATYYTIGNIWTDPPPPSIPNKDKNIRRWYPKWSTTIHTTKPPSSSVSTTDHNNKNATKDNAGLWTMILHPSIPQSTMFVT